MLGFDAISQREATLVRFHHFFVNSFRFVILNGIVFLHDRCEVARAILLQRHVDRRYRSVVLINCFAIVFICLVGAFPSNGRFHR